MQNTYIPQLTDKDNSKEYGNAHIVTYSIIHADKDDSPIFNSEISIDLEDRIDIKLFNNRLLDFNE